jgi:hypothetical protein
MTAVGHLKTRQLFHQKIVERPVRADVAPLLLRLSRHSNVLSALLVFGTVLFTQIEVNRLLTYATVCGNCCGIEAGTARCINPERTNMSLEAKIEALTLAVTALTEAQTEHTERLNAVLANGGKAASGDGEDKPKRTRAKKEDKPAETDGDGDTGEGDEGSTTTSTLTNDGVKKDVVAPWLSEFINDKGETDARKTKIKGALAKLVGKEGATVADVPAGDLQRLVDWVAKQKETDAGFGKGRLTAVASAAGSDEEDI